MRDKPKIFILDCCRGENIAQTYKAVEKNSGIRIAKGPPPTWIYERFHPNSGFATILVIVKIMHVPKQIKVDY